MRPGPHQIGTAGAIDGDALIYDADLDEWVPGSITPATRLVPWTTTLSDGTPALMWDDDDNLMMVEVS